jgi:predicted DNA-binding transcriptional regulator YafY
VSTAVLGELALACRDAERVRFSYTSAAGETTMRRVEPHYLAPADRHWYLLCWDLDRDDWRTFRVDRLDQLEHTRVLFQRKSLTPEEVEEFILVARSWVRQPVEADIVMELPLDEVRAQFGQWSQGATAEDAARTRWPVGGGDWREAMYGISWVPTGVDYVIDLADPARAELHEALTRMLRALDSPPPPPRQHPR